MSDYKLFLILLLLCISKCYSQPDGYFDDNDNPDQNENHVVADIPRFGAVAEADFSVWYGCGGNGFLRAQIEKPFIWVEGIDLDPQNNEYLSNTPPSNAFAQHLYIDLARRGFDIIQVNFNTNPTYIQRNAEVIVSLIEDIIEQMEEVSTNEIVIMGTSMGAIITRYALALMEIRNSIRYF